MSTVPNTKKYAQGMEPSASDSKKSFKFDSIHHFDHNHFPQLFYINSTTGLDCRLGDCVVGRESINEINDCMWRCKIHSPAQTHLHTNKHTDFDYPIHLFHIPDADTRVCN